MSRLFLLTPQSSHALSPDSLVSRPPHLPAPIYSINHPMQDKRQAYSMTKLPAACSRDIVAWVRHRAKGIRHWLAFLSRPCWGKKDWDESAVGWVESLGRQRIG